MTGGAYRLRRAFEVFEPDDGDVYLLRGGSGQEHVIQQPGEAERELLRRLAAGPVELEPGTAAMDSVAPLIAAGAVVGAWDAGVLGATDAERFDRQLPYLEDSGDPVELQRRLREASVAVIGCGGLGSWTIAALASAGVGRFVLFDHDTVELSNLNRQVLFGAADTGRSKAELTAAWLERFDPAVSVAAHAEAVGSSGDLDAAADCDVWILLADYPPYEIVRWVNAAALRHGVPFVTAGQQPPLVKVGPFYRPGVGACYGCHERGLASGFALHDELSRHRAAHPPPAATLGPASALVGATLALDVMHHLLDGRAPATADRMRIVDIRTLEASWAAIERDPECKVCGERG